MENRDDLIKMGGPDDIALALIVFIGVLILSLHPGLDGTGSKSHGYHAN